MQRIYTSLFILLFSITSLSAQVWTPLGTGINGIVNASEMYRGELYVGGLFTMADGSPAANIARWDGNQWHALLGGVNNTVYAMAVYHNKLIVGGTFTQADSLNCKRIASWDGTSWDTLTKGVIGFGVYALTVHDNKLYAGGKFSQAGYVNNVNNIAVWNDTAWSNVGSGFTAYFGVTNVYSLASYQGELYAGGWFQIASNDSTCYNMAHWDGNIWHNLNGDGPDDYVKSLTVYQGKLYIGGNFYGTYYGTPMHYLGTWDGSSYAAVGLGANDNVNAMYIYGNLLYIGGKFTEVNNQPMQHITSWNGNQFASLNLGIDTTVKTIVADDGIVFAGGEFSQADGNPASRVAKFSELGVSIHEINSIAFSIFPNPSSGIFNLNSEEQSLLEIYNASGQLIRSVFISNKQTEIDLTGEAVGIYFWRMIGENEMRTGKIVIQ
jgi:trimeric autotransporter adhesin